MAQLAIKGHETRGKEVIEILKMLGGENINDFSGEYDNMIYTNKSFDYGEIISMYYVTDGYKVFTLEEFLEKFPYKVGDKVIAYAEGCLASFTIQNMRWNSELNKVEYKICSSWIDASLIMRYCKEENMEKQKKDYEEWFPIDYIEFEDNEDTWSDEVEVNLGKDYEIQIRGDKTFIVKKKPQYPKTYVECAKMLDCFGAAHIDGYKGELLEKLQELIVCRDAYWKIAGEEMGLGKPWEPEPRTHSKERYVIITDENDIPFTTGSWSIYRVLLEFPTKEMRDAFYENFKDLIEVCKEFL